MRASLPSKPEAARYYVEGLARMRLLDALAARDLLEKAVAADAKHPLPHAALAEAWTALGYEGRAKQEAAKAAELAVDLPREERLSIEARFHESSGDWNGAIERRRALFDSFPDSVDHGLRLASAQTFGGRARDALVTVESLRRLAPPSADDPRIDLAEARAHQELGDAKRQQALAAAAAEKARALGARLLLARARLLESTALDVLGEPEKAMAAAEEARDLYAAVGDAGQRGAGARADRHPAAPARGPRRGPAALREGPCDPPGDRRRGQRREGGAQHGLGALRPGEAAGGRADLPAVPGHLPRGRGPLRGGEHAERPRGGALQRRRARAAPRRGTRRRWRSSARSGRRAAWR